MTDLDTIVFQRWGKSGVSDKRTKLYEFRQKIKEYAFNQGRKWYNTSIKGKGGILWQKKSCTESNKDIPVS